jgi:hypothetical protein
MSCEQTLTVLSMVARHDGESSHENSPELASAAALSSSTRVNRPCGLARRRANASGDALWAHASHGPGRAKPGSAAASARASHGLAYPQRAMTTTIMGWQSIRAYLPA